MLNQEFPERLQLTYKPEGDDASPSEGTPSPNNESKPPGLDIVAVSSVEESSPITAPPPANNFDSEDLLVNIYPYHVLSGNVQ